MSEAIERGAALKTIDTPAATDSIQDEPSSYRDRNGSVFYDHGRVLRRLSAKAAADWEALSKSEFFGRSVQDGKLIGTELVETRAPGERWAAIVEHERVPFISYPYEWTFGQLKDAALLHLELMRAALDEGMILKDSSAYNVQWRGMHPVFIDTPSFEILRKGEPWVGYRQFCELFLYPLMLQAYKGLDFKPFLRGRIDGISADEMRRMMSARDMARSGVLLHVVAQSALQRRYSGSASNVRGALAEAGFDKRLIESNVSKLTKLVRGLDPPGTETEWSDYDKTHSYDEVEFQRKIAFVRNAAAGRRWKLAWDLGCNTGTFSRIVAEHADYVVAMDGDWMAIEHFYQRERAGDARSSILPLVINLADSSPNQGWRGAERKGLAERGRPELTLCLALIHHIVISANIPLASFLDWLKELGTAVVIEFVGRDDEMVKTLLANREDQYDDYHPDIFEALLGERFAIRDRQDLKGGKRTIYFAEPHSR
ncbi:methyltransferase [Pararhizobium haloflavum]|uniref:methyltransferase n=1 Tax=Pararhizobium haloflavum TaxID=2037914 RepID=UPI000C17E710|nr:methyltransferase [Pararhizobium haloflavum]